MNLVELRTNVVRQCGRTNLVGFTLDVDGIRVPNFEEDRGVDRFINSAIKTLSNEIKTQDNLRHYSATVGGDIGGIVIPGFLQAPKRGVNIDGDPICWILQQDVRGYLDTDIDHTGKPEWWFRIAPKDLFPAPYFYDDAGTDKNYEVGLYPAPDQEYQLTVSCWTYVPLLANEDENWWSMYEPKSIVDLACAEINASELNADRRVLDATLERVKFNLLARDILEEEVHTGNTIA